MHSKNLYLALTLIFLIALTGVYYSFNPAEYRFYPRCPFYILTSFCCPGCGSQRAVYNLLHGHLIAAVKDNVLLVISLPLLMIQLIYKAKAVWLKKDLRWNAVYHPLTPKIILAVVMLFWILRNIPAVPFSYLSPNH